MALLSVIRRWALRDQLSIREIARRTGLSRNTIRKYLRAGTVEPKFRSARASKLDLRRQAVGLAEDGGGQVAQAAADLEAAARRSGRPRLRGLLQPGRGLRADVGRPPARTQTAGRGTFVPLAFPPGRPSSSTGARTGRRLPGRTRSSRSPTSSSRTAGRSCSGPTCCRPTRCCSMPTGTPSGSSAACRGGASTTT